MPEPKKSARQELIDRLPKEMQLPAERILIKYKVINDEDPIFALTEVLGFNCAFFETIPRQVFEAGMSVEGQTTAALKAFDERIATLRGLAVLIQKATDRLEHVPQEIADRFPSQQIARQLAEQIEGKLKALPLGKFEISIKAVQDYVEAFAQVSSRYTDALLNQGSQLKKQVETLENRQAEVNRSAGWGWNGAFMLLGAAMGATFTTGILWLMWGWPLATIFQSQSFIGVNAVAGADEHGPLLYVPKSKMIAYSPDAQGNLTIRFKPEPTPSPRSH